MNTTRQDSSGLSLLRIPPAGVSRGPINFDLFARLRGKMVLFCRKGFEIADRHMEALQRLDLDFYVRKDDWGEFSEYARKNLEIIVEDTSVNVVEKSRLISEYSRKRIKEILEEPENKDVPKMAYRIAKLHAKLINTSPESIISLFALSSLDEYNVSHSINTCLLNILIGGICLGDDPGMLVKLGMSGLLHDIGKLNIDQNLITKPAKLSLAEFEKVKLHAVEGERILSRHDLDDLFITTARSHHERLDGSGYPDKLEQFDIPRFARITAVSDVYDALTSRRIYKDEIMPIEALRLMMSEKNKYDAGALNALFKVTLRSEKLINKIKEMRGQSRSIEISEPRSLEVFNA